MNVQLILVLTLAILTISIAAVCFYVINILRDIKDTIRRTNVILDDAQGLTSKLAHPTPTLLNIAETTINAVKALKELTHRDNGAKSDRLEELAQKDVEDEYSVTIEGEAEYTSTEENNKQDEEPQEQITNLFDLPAKPKDKNFFRGTFKQ